MPDSELHKQRKRAAELTMKRQAEKDEAEAKRMATLPKPTATNPPRHVVVGPTQPPPTPATVVIDPASVKVVQEVKTVRVTLATYTGPEVLVTHRQHTAERAGFPMYDGFERSLESAIDEAAGRAGRDKQDVVVWKGNRVAAVVTADDEGRVQVTPFMEIPTAD